MLSIIPIPAFSDNYIWAIINQEQQSCVVVDPGCAKAVDVFLRNTQLNLSAILVTHHHADHVGGIAKLNPDGKLPVYGPSLEATEWVNQPLSDGGSIVIPGIARQAQVIAVPGHTLGHIAFYLPNHLFCGDTLFSAGCGRLFEGTAKQMYTSLARLAALDEDTKVYCAHEYTQSNLAFAQQVEPTNKHIKQYCAAVTKKRTNNLASLPSTIGLEKRVNPFMRCQHAQVKQAAEQFAQHPCATPVEVFAALRTAKDQF